MCMTDDARVALFCKVVRCSPSDVLDIPPDRTGKDEDHSAQQPAAHSQTPKAGRRTRIATSASQRGTISARAAELGVELAETLIAGKVPSPHWRFLKRGEVIMHYWPATERYWMLSDGAKGTRPLDGIIDFLAAELHDLRGVV